MTEWKHHGYRIAPNEGGTGWRIYCPDGQLVRSKVPSIVDAVEAIKAMIGGHPGKLALARCAVQRARRAVWGQGGAS